MSVHRTHHVLQDNLINQRLLMKLLTSLQCIAQSCKDGRECVDLLVSLARQEDPTKAELNRFDLVLMDLEMCVASPFLSRHLTATLRPVLDGLAATREIRQLEANHILPYSVPIVAVSGNARSEWTERARNAGMDGFLRKPYNRTQLQEVLGRWRPIGTPAAAT
jgi:two-component system, sensor histidine kinase